MTWHLVYIKPLDPATSITVCKPSTIFHSLPLYYYIFVTTSTMGSKIIQLAQQILSNTEKVSEHLQSHSLPQPSFDINGPLDFDIKIPSVEAARLSAIEASMELQDLLIGPTMILRPVVCLIFPQSEITSRTTCRHERSNLCSKYNATSLQAIYKFDIARKIPIDSDISFTDLAKLCDIYEPDLKRILRFAMCYYHVFCEPRKGFVAHTLLLAPSTNPRVSGMRWGLCLMGVGNRTQEYDGI